MLFGAVMYTSKIWLLSRMNEKSQVMLPSGLKISISGFANESCPFLFRTEMWSGNHQQKSAYELPGLSTAPSRGERNAQGRGEWGRSLLTWRKPSAPVSPGTESFMVTGDVDVPQSLALPYFYFCFCFCF